MTVDMRGLTARLQAAVESGVVLDDLQAAAAPHGLTFGPDPSIHNRCTLGGMIGNNACGVHSATAGRTVDNVASLDVLLHDGTRLTLGEDAGGDLDTLAAAPGRSDEIHRRLRDIRDRYPPIPRGVSGYNLDELLGERGGNVARALVGSEGTRAITLGAAVRLVPRPAARAMLVLGYPSLAAAGDHVPELLDAGPIGLEGIDGEVVDGARRRGNLSGVSLPEGRAWLLAEFGDDRPETARSRARVVANRLSDQAVRVVTDPAAQGRLWGSASRASATTSATFACCWSSTASTRRSTGASGTAACTRRSASTTPRRPASRPTGASSRMLPILSSPTTDRVRRAR